jgi:hypothetical protein
LIHSEELLLAALSFSQGCRRLQGESIGFAGCEFNGRRRFNNNNNNLSDLAFLTGSVRAVF